MISELTRDNPRLLELEEQYRKLDMFETSQWDAFSKSIDIQNFRGEPGYLSQMWNMIEEKYQNTYDYAVRCGLEDDIRLLGEDGAFGAITFLRKETGLTFSRDLLDSVFEIAFIRETIGVPASVLDIGAGYGRLLHRLAQLGLAGIYMGIDAIPISTFLCEYYLRRRGCFAQTWTVPMTGRLGVYHADLAINCYSFSEMPLSWVKFWLSWCADLNIKYFFLVPHAGDLIHPHFVTSEPNGDHLDYYHLFERYGYKLMVQRPKFPRDIAPTLIYSTDYLLFKRG